MIHRHDSTTTKTIHSKTSSSNRSLGAGELLGGPRLSARPPHLSLALESTLTEIKPSYSKRQVPTGAFEIEPNGTILHFRPYDANGVSIDELEGLNLFEDVVRISSDRDATYFVNCFERGESFRTSRHLLHGRDLTLVLLYHENTNTYWGFLGPN